MSVNLFDAKYYQAVNPDLAAAGLTTYEQLFSHFQNSGLSEGRAFSRVVDLKFYQQNNPDLTAAGLTTYRQVYEHLQNFGVAQIIFQYTNTTVVATWYGAKSWGLVQEGRRQRAEGRREEGFSVELFTCFQLLNHFCHTALAIHTPTLAVLNSVALQSITLAMYTL